MPQIKPTSVQDLLEFIRNHRPDIENGTYDILIENDWVPQIPLDVMFFLVKHCPSCRLTLSGNRNTPRDILAILARDQDAHIRLEVAGNANVPVEVLAVLAKDSNPDIRGRVAGNGDTPPDVLAALSKDDTQTQHTEGGYFRLTVSQLVAYNQRAPQNVLSILARSTNPDTCRIVALNSNISDDILAALAKNPDLEVRSAVARNPKTPPNVLDVLSQDTNDYVRKAADPLSYVREVKKRKQQDALKPCLIFFGIIGGICGLIFGCGVGVAKGNPVGGLLGGLLVGLLIGAAVGYLWSFLAMFQRIDRY